MSLTGCVDSDPAENAGAEAPSSAAEEGALVFYNWEEYCPTEVLEAFTAETGIPVVYETFGTLDEMIARLRSEPGSVDVIVADDSTVSDLAELGLLERLDHGKFSNLENVDSRYLGLPFDKANAYSVPYLWGSTLIGYRKDKIESPERSWSALWNPEYAGNVMMLDEPEDLFCATLMERGYSRNSKKPSELNEAYERLVQQIETVRVRYGTDVEIREALVEGDVWIAQCYSGDAAMGADENENVAYFIPKEGSPLWIDSLTIASDSERVGKAHQFIDFMMKAEMAAECANFAWFPSPNKAAYPLLSDDLVADEELFPREEVLSRCAFSDMSTLVDREQILNDRMNELLSLQKNLKGAGGEGAVSEKKEAVSMADSKE